jgi:chromosome segregation ATPase
VREQPRTQSFALVECDLPSLLAYAKEGKASQAVVDAVKKAAAINARAQEQQRTVREIEARMNELREEQSRIRSNMNSLDRNSDLYRRYTTKLGEQESQVEAWMQQRDAAQAAQRAAEEELRAYLRDLDVA